jgi:CheY-like chemotaxis protein
MITVLDTGLGMVDEVRKHAIEPFFTTKDVGKGSGLGLSQVFGFARQSGGYLQLDSEPGKGTVVRLLLPRVQVSMSGTRGVKTTSKGAVLVVEDQPEVLEIAVEMLTSGGYRAYTAEDGKQALRLLQSSIPIDVLFIDIVMPGGMNGIELAKKGHELRPEIQVLLTSGYPRDALENQHGLKDDYKLLAKPYCASALINEVGRATNRRHVA